jgi:hypothetical protein
MLQYYVHASEFAIAETTWDAAMLQAGGVGGGYIGGGARSACILCRFVVRIEDQKEGAMQPIKGAKLHHLSLSNAGCLRDLIFFKITGTVF